MREIKFRVWDKELKYMHVCGTDVHDSMIFLGHNCQCTYYNLQNGDGSSEKGSYILMQYTGLKDKNEKEIYEGDILKLPVWLLQDDENEKCICIYAEEHQTSEIIGFGLYLKNSYSGKYQDLVPSDEWDEFEVIGNIYENPELLKEG